MKPTTAITVITFVLVGAFAFYTSAPEEIPDTPRTNQQANISESVVNEPPVSETKPQPSVTLDSFEDIGSEFNAILEGQNEWQADFDRVEDQEEATSTLGN